MSSGEGPSCTVNGGGNNGEGEQQSNNNGQQLAAPQQETMDVMGGECARTVPDMDSSLRPPATLPAWGAAFDRGRESPGCATCSALSRERFPALGRICSAQ